MIYLQILATFHLDLARNASSFRYNAIVNEKEVFRDDEEN